MPLPAGSKLGSYEVIAPLGAGGMGEVYRARDTRLGREVAIKVLPADRMHDEGRRRRFLQEAQSASALNHPHIVTIHEIESEGDFDFIVMEYVRGASLDTIIPRQGLRLSELLRIAIPVADAVAAAHARGIIHRDLKPANVMIGEGGVVKVLDFGLAKLTTADESGLPDIATITQVAAAGLSAPGAIMGTAAYMAPEQAAAGKVDARSDIFSFGAMLYEMATGTKAFAGSSVADTLAAVLRAQPTPPTQIATALPRDLERLILRCLKKEPDRRYQLMLDVKNELQEIKEESDSGTLGVVTPPAGRRRTLAIAAAALTVVVVAVGAIALRYLRPHGEPDLPPMRVVPLTSLNGAELHPSVSPDGDQVAFSWDDSKEYSRGGWDHFDIYLKLVGSSEVRRLTNDPGRNWVGGWSPDGRQIACVHETEKGNTISVISTVTGAQRNIIAFPSNGSPRWSPDGRGLIIAGDATAPNGGGIYYIPLEGGSPRLVMPQPKTVDLLAGAQPAPDGHHLGYFACAWKTGCSLDVVELDDKGQSVSTPRHVAKEPRSESGFTWTRDSASVLYTTAPAPETFYLWRAWINGERAPERLELAGLGARMPSAAAGRDRLVFVRSLNSIGVYTLEAAPRPVLLTAFWDIQPQFSPDGTQIVFTSSRSGEGLEIWLAAADGSNSHQLTHGPGRYQGSPSWSPDGHRIAFDSKETDGGDQAIWTIDADGGNARLVVKGLGDHGGPTWSRDRRWIYFWSGATGSSHDTWRVLATGGSPERVTRDGSALFALESMDGQDLIYKRDNFGDSPLLAQPLTGGPVRQLLPCVNGVNYAVGPAGIYYAACGPGPQRSIHLFDKVRRDRVLGAARDPWGYWLNRLAVSPDGKTVLVQQQTLSADLMRIENFR